MSEVRIRPERGLLTMWWLGWGIAALVGIIVLVMVYLANDDSIYRTVFGLVLLGFLVVMVLFGIWLPVFYNSMEYTAGKRKVWAKYGVFWRQTITVPYRQIINVDVIQGPLQRLFNLGTIKVQTAGAGGQQGARAELRLLGIRDLEKVKQLLTERSEAMDSSSQESLMSPEDYPSGTSDELMQQMLEELRAIRKLLEQK